MRTSQSATNARHDLEAKGFQSDNAHERRRIVNNRTRKRRTYRNVRIVIWMVLRLKKLVEEPSAITWNSHTLIAPGAKPSK